MFIKCFYSLGLIHKRVNVYAFGTEPDGGLCLQSLMSAILGARENHSIAADATFRGYRKNAKKQIPCMNLEVIETNTVTASKHTQKGEYTVFFTLMLQYKV